MKCCKLMEEALAYAAQRETYPSGLRMQQAFNLTTFKPTRELLIYWLPGHGKGKERKPSQTFMVRCCPFCGKSTGIDAELKRERAKTARAAKKRTPKP